MNFFVVCEAYCKYTDKISTKLDKFKKWPWV